VTESERTKKIQEILREIEKLPTFPKLSEADTCEKVISRLMREVAGYKYEDYIQQAVDSLGSKPDYEFLPSTGQSWYLEAKAWDTPLKDEHAAQALNYANQNGRRWVVLSNGSEWRLYDNAIMGTPTQKLVATANHKDLPRLAAFLEGISKESVQAGRIADYALFCRMSRLLDKQLKDPNSEIVQALVQKLQECGLAGVTGEHVVRYFQPPQPPPDDGWFTLDDLLKNPSQVKFTKPKEIRMPDSTLIPVETWVAVLQEALSWLHQNGKLPPAPYPPESGSLFNSTPNTVKGKPYRNYKPVKGVGYVECHLSSRSIITWLKRLCKQNDIPTNSISIRLVSQGRV
jgi:hypothetical protein